MVEKVDFKVEMRDGTPSIGCERRASRKNGILTVAVPRSGEAKPKAIPISAE